MINISTDECRGEIMSLSENEIKDITKIIVDKIKEKDNKDKLRTCILNTVKRVYNFNSVNKIEPYIEAYITVYFRKIIYINSNNMCTYFGEISKYLRSEDNYSYWVENGIGVLIYKFNDKYIGEWKNGLKFGYGDMDYDIGNNEFYVWSGKWENGIKVEKKGSTKCGFWKNRIKVN
tara:strand:- start:517 stop:1044 length:528 start_codon:yes stop_codon:yes gene_type:complete